MLNDLLLTILNIYRSRSIKSNVAVVELFNYLFALLALLTVLEDTNLDKFYNTIRSPHVIACAIFLMLYAQLKQFVRLVYEIVLPWNR